jgi:enoyl-CoA hydratase/carnithine racemase
MQFSDYAERYSTIKFTRHEGVLEIILHTRGGEAKWGTSARSLHAELGNAFLDVARDPENKIIILTGTGQNFIASSDDQETAPEQNLAAMWDRIYDEATGLLENLLALPVPVIAAVNGPAYIHAELAVLSDIVLAAEHAEFADLAHPGRAVPGDGVHTVWPMLLGPNRGRYFLLTGQKLSARQAQDLGVVAEILPAEKLMPRARELGQLLAQRPRRQLRYTRAVLVRHLRRRLREDLDTGLAMEALAML